MLLFDYSDVNPLLMYVLYVVLFVSMFVSFYSLFLSDRVEFSLSTIICRAVFSVFWLWFSQVALTL